MTISCGFCGVVLLESDLVFVTCCGHIFHGKCLFNRRDSNCPQCYAMCTTFPAQRLYLSFTDDTPNEEDRNELLIEINKMKNDISEQQRSLAIHEKLVLTWTEYEKCFPIYTNLLKTNYERKLLKLSSLKQEKTSIEKRLDELKTLEKLQTVLAGTTADVDEMLQMKISPEILATMIVLLRSETRAVDDEQKAYRTVLRDSQKETKELYSKQSTLLEKIEMLSDTNNKLKNSP